MKSKKLKIILGIVSVLIILLVIGIRWANKPQEGSISNPTPSNTTKATYSDKQLDSRYMSFTYSGKYVLKNDGAKDDNLEHYTLSAATQYDKRILASVANLSDGRLESNGAFIMRQKSPQNYTSRIFKTGGYSFTVWVKSDGLEQTAMLPVGNKAVVISLVTANSNDDLTQEVNTLLSSFRWK